MLEKVINFTCAENQWIDWGNVIKINLIIGSMFNLKKAMAIFRMYFSP